MASATVYIHGGDMDCSEMVRVCYRAVDVLPYGSYMWTGNEVALLTSHGFVQRSLSSPQIGDVLWRSGHTEIYLGDGMQGGARGSEYGTITGAKGDQTGYEIARSAYRASDWTKLLRYEGGKTVDGIPCAIAAALVADHIIDHSAHGYSQPNRAGDGTVEEVTITYGGEAQELTLTLTFLKPMPIREGPSIHARKVGTYPKGSTVRLEGAKMGSDGRWWGWYTGSSSGKVRYVCVGDAGGRCKAVV